MIKLTENNEYYTKATKTLITVILYFIWPSFCNFIFSIFGIKVNEIGTFISNIILLCIIISIYLKDIYLSLRKISIKKIIFLLISLIIVQIFTNLLSVSILGLKNHDSHCGLLPDYLNNWPILMGISIVGIYPILESLVFSKVLKDVINCKWVFIICSSLFFWLVNILSFNFSLASIVATMSCFTTSIIINYFYYKYDNISSIIIVKMIYNLIFLMLP